jgi:preprotein translocase subunit SecD
MSEEKITQVEKTANELGVSVSKIEAVAEENTVITVPKKKSKSKASAEAVINDTIGSSISEEPKKEELKKVEKPKQEKIAVFSTRNVYWEGIGEIQRGYNFITPEQAESWLKRTHVRIASPEEIKEVFDK